MTEDANSAAETLRVPGKFTLAGTRVDQPEEIKSRPQLRSFPAVSGPIAGFFSRVAQRLGGIAKLFDEVATSEKALETAEADFVDAPSSRSLDALLKKRRRVRDLRDSLPDEELLFVEAEEAILLRPDAWRALSAACFEKARELAAIRDGVLNEFLDLLREHVLETRTPHFRLDGLHDTAASTRIYLAMRSWRDADSYSQEMNVCGTRALDVAEGRSPENLTVRKFESTCEMLASTTQLFKK
jgi:hypothetical protein